MNRRAFRGWVAIAASIAVCLLTAVAAPAARAGAIWVTDGAGSCNAFSVYGDFASFSVPSSCPMSIQAVNRDPGGAERLLDDDRATRDHDQPGVDRERRRERRRLDHRRGRRRLLAETSRPARGADRRSRRASTGSTPGSRAARTSTARSTASRSSAHKRTGPSGALLLLNAAVVHGLRDRRSRAPKTRRPSSRDRAPCGRPDRTCGIHPGMTSPSRCTPATCPASAPRGRTAGAAALNGPSEPRDDSVWQQCPNPVSWSFGVDTRSQVPTDGNFQIDLSATNAAGMVDTATEDRVGG